MRTHRFVAWSCLWLLMSFACERAGVAQQPEWLQGNPWRIDPRPILRVGAADGPEALLFSGIIAAVLASNGNLIVADSRSREIRVFARDGAHIRTFGGRGDGPGEFRDLGSLALMNGDTIVAADPTRRRLEMFDALGRHVLSTPLNLRGFTPLIVGAFSDGTFALVSGNVSFGSQEGLRQDTVIAVRVHRNGELADTIVKIPGLMGYNYFEEGRPAGTLIVPFTSLPSFRAVGDQLITAEGSSYQIDVRDVHGNILSTVTRPWVAERVSDEDVQAYARRTRGDEGSRPRQRAMENLPYPKAHPSVENLLGSPDGYIWVKVHMRQSTSEIWDVINPRREWLGRLQIPGDLHVLSVSTNSIVVIERDSDGVEYVQVHRILK